VRGRRQLGLKKEGGKGSPAGKRYVNVGAPGRDRKVRTIFFSMLGEKRSRIDPGHTGPPESKRGKEGKDIRYVKKGEFLMGH